MGFYPHARPPDPEAYAAGLAAVLEQYPIGLVAECCHPVHGVTRYREFPPTLAAVIDWCERRLAAYQAILRRGPPQPERVFSEAHCATMRARLRDLAAQLKAGLRRVAAAE